MSELAHTDKQAVISAAIPLLQQGASTDSIVQKLGLPITGRTLRNWLIATPEAQDARAHFLSEKLAESLEEIEAADDDFPLARAREKFRSWAWVAERRLPQLFGQKVEQLGGVSIKVVIGDPLQAAKTVVNVPKCDAASSIIESEAGDGDASP